jgi:hypothetical protein
MTRSRKRAVVLTALLSAWAVAWAIFFTALLAPGTPELPGWVVIPIAHAMFTPIFVVRVLRRDVRKNARLSEEERRRWSSRLRWWGVFAALTYALRAME